MSQSDAGRQLTTSVHWLAGAENVPIWTLPSRRLGQAIGIRNGGSGTRTAARGITDRDRAAQRPV